MGHIKPAVLDDRGHPERMKARLRSAQAERDFHQPEALFEKLDTLPLGDDDGSPSVYPSARWSSGLQCHYLSVKTDDLGICTVTTPPHNVPDMGGAVCFAFRHGNTPRAIVFLNAETGKAHTIYVRDWVPGSGGFWAVYSTDERRNRLVFTGLFPETFHEAEAYLEKRRETDA